MLTCGFRALQSGIFGSWFWVETLQGWTNKTAAVFIPRKLSSFLCIRAIVYTIGNHHIYTSYHYLRRQSCTHQTQNNKPGSYARRIHSCPMQVPVEPSNQYSTGPQLICFFLVVLFMQRAGLQVRRNADYLLCLLLPTGLPQASARES